MILSQVFPTRAADVTVQRAMNEQGCVIIVPPVTHGRCGGSLYMEVHCVPIRPAGGQILEQIVPVMAWPAQ